MDDNFLIIDDSPDIINFLYKDVVVLTLSKSGFKYKGVLIEDAGEAHRAFLEVMRMLKNGS